ncbi:MAG: restriction endonuclease subunit S [Acidimicrobiia bacterium]
MLSVYRDLGVIPKAERSDNFNKTPEDLSLYKLVHPGDVVVNKMKAWQGSIAVSGHRGIVSGDYLVCEVTGDVDLRFLHHLLRSRPLVDQYAMRAKGIRPSQWRLYWEDLADISVDFPVLSAQEAIADFLDVETARIDALITAKRRMIDLLEARRSTTVVAAVSGLDQPDREPTDLPWLDSLPTHWRAVKLGFLARLGSGHTPSRNRPEWWVDCTIPWITTGEVVQMRSDRIEEIYETREKISELGMANSSATLHPKGTVVLCRTASAGYSAIMGANMATSQDFATWTCGSSLNPRFLLLCLRAMRTDLLERLAMGSTHRTIYMPDIESIRVPLPPINEQDQIVEDTWQRLRRIDRTSISLQRQIDLLVERRQALITAAVTGELAVPGVAA